MCIMIHKSGSLESTKGKKYYADIFTGVIQEE